MLFEVVTPYKQDSDNTYLKSLNTLNSYASNNAWDMLYLLTATFPSYKFTICNFDGFENAVRLPKEPTD